MFVDFEGEVQQVLLIGFSLILRRQLLPLVFLIYFWRSYPILFSLIWNTRLVNTCKRDVVRRRKDSVHNFISTVVKMGGICGKICSTFAPPVMTGTHFVSEASTFGDQATRNANRHLQTQRHKDVVSNKLTSDNLSK